MAPTINVSAAGKVPVLYWVAGAGGLFVAYTFYKRIRSTGSAPAAAPVAATSTPVVAAQSYGQDYTGQFANIQQQLQSLQNPSPASSTTAGTKYAGAITPTAANQVLSGSGYEPNANQPQKKYTPVSSNSHLYIAVTDLLEAGLLGGANLYYQPTAGVFALIPGGSVNNLSAGTTIYRQVA